MRKQVQKGEITSQATLVVDGRAWVRTWFPDSESKLLPLYYGASPDRKSQVGRARPDPLSEY